MTQRTKSNGMLTLTSLIWGVAFVAQSVGMDYVGPFTFNSIRCLLGGLVLIPCIVLLDKKDPNRKPMERKIFLTGGVLCGLVLAVASSLQQFGILYTSVGKAGFITSLYILIVPLFGLFIGKRVGAKLWVSIAVALAGMYLLCMNGGFTIGLGDGLMLLCAVGFSLHILVIDHYSPKTDGVRLSCIQFFTCGALCTVPMFLFESPSLQAIFSAAVPILYAGVLSCGVAYTLQVIAQKHTSPTVASLLLSLESVFSVLAGWLLLGQGLSLRELFGCVLVFAAIILAQLPALSSLQKRPHRPI